MTSTGFPGYSLTLGPGQPLLPSLPLWFLRVNSPPQPQLWDVGTCLLCTVCFGRSPNPPNLVKLDLPFSAQFCSLISRIIQTGCLFFFVIFLKPTGVLERNSTYRMGYVLNTFNLCHPPGVLPPCSRARLVWFSVTNIQCSVTVFQIRDDGNSSVGIFGNRVGS